MKQSDLAKPEAPSAVTLWSKAGHSLRQPVQGALYIIHVLKAQLSQEPAQLQLVDKLGEAVHSLQVQIELLTALAQKSNVTPQPLELSALLTDVAAGLPPAAAEHGVRMLLGAKPPVAVSSDRHLLSLAIAGLIQNALRLSSEGRWLLGVRPRGALVRVEVYYQGPIVSQAQSEAAFITLPHLQAGRPAGAPALGLGFIAHICQVLGHHLEFSRCEHRTQRITLVLQRAPG